MSYSGYQDKDALGILKKYQQINESDISTPGLTIKQDIEGEAPPTGPGKENTLWYMIQIADPTGLTNVPDVIDGSYKLYQTYQDPESTIWERGFQWGLLALAIYCAIPNFGVLGAGVAAIPWAGVRMAAKKARSALQRALKDPNAYAEAATIINKEVLPFLNRKEVLQAMDEIAAKMPAEAKGFVDEMKQVIELQDITRNKWWQGMYDFVYKSKNPAQVTKELEQKYVSTMHNVGLPAPRMMSGARGSLEGRGWGARTGAGFGRGTSYAARALEQPLSQQFGFQGSEMSGLQSAAQWMGYKPKNDQDFKTRTQNLFQRR